MGSTERLPSPRPHDPTEDPPRVSGDVLTTNGEAPDLAEELTGKVIGGRYRVADVLGRGGMGVVYRALHLELDQEVAIKVLPTSYARDAETLKRFEREAKTASRVRHPNVVTVFDLGRLDTGEPYLVMELLTGKDLAQVMADRGTLPLKEVVEIMTPVAAALDALHVEGVVHRDIKPSNIFFTKTKAMGEIVKLVDFGLAALHSVEGTERLTSVGHVVGTAVYMAPEAARGALSGPRGDTYALAVVAYEMLTGLAPFDGMPMAVLLDKLSGPAPRLSQISGNTYDESVEAAFALALQRDAERRPATASAFVDMLRTALREGAVMPRTGLRSRPPPRDAPSPEAEAPRATQDEQVALPAPSRAPWIAVAAIQLVAAMGGAWWAWGSGSSRAPVAPMPTLAPTPHEQALVIAAPTEIEPAPALEATQPEVATPAPHADHTHTARPHADTAPPPTTAIVAPPTSVVLEPPPPPPPSPPPTAAASEGSSTDRSATLLRDAQTAMLHGQIANARDLYDEATQASPRAPAAWCGLGLASERLGLAPEARRAYERYLEIAPDARDAPTVRDRLTRLSQ